MGSWNGTCFISDLPILEDEDVIIIPAVQARGRLQAILAPMEGIANDYGGVKAIYPTPAAHRCYVFLNANLGKPVDEAVILATKQAFAEREAMSKRSQEGDSTAMDNYTQVVQAGRDASDLYVGKFILSTKKGAPTAGPIRLQGSTLVIRDVWTEVPKEAAVLLLLINKTVWETLRARLLKFNKFTHMLPKDETDPVTGNGWSNLTGEDYLKQHVEANAAHMIELEVKCEVATRRDNPEFAETALHKRCRRMSIETSMIHFVEFDELAYDKEMFLDLFAPNGEPEDILEETSVSMLREIWILGMLLARMRKELRVPAGTGSSVADYGLSMTLGAAICAVSKTHLDEQDEDERSNG